MEFAIRIHIQIRIPIRRWIRIPIRILIQYSYTNAALWIARRPYKWSNRLPSCG